MSLRTGPLGMQLCLDSTLLLRRQRMYTARPQSISPSQSRSTSALSFNQDSKCHSHAPSSTTR